MKTVQVILSQPWPTAMGLRRPQEGVISVSPADAEAIEEAGAGEIVDAGDGDKPKRAKKSAVADAATPVE